MKAPTYQGLLKLLIYRRAFHGLKEMTKFYNYGLLQGGVFSPRLCFISLANRYCFYHKNIFQTLLFPYDQVACCFQGASVGLGHLSFNCMLLKMPVRKTVYVTARSRSLSMWPLDETLSDSRLLLQPISPSSSFVWKFNFNEKTVLSLNPLPVRLDHDTL